MLAFSVLGGTDPGCVRFGCSPTHPGETFFAGYISPDKQTTVGHTFIVRNTTNDAVEIRSVDKLCSCTSFELGKYRLERGESTTLVVNVDVLRGFMTRTTACILRTDHPKFKDWTYGITFVSTPFAVAAPSVLNLGYLKPDGQNPDTVKELTLDLFTESAIELERGNFTVPDEIDLNILEGREPKAPTRYVEDDIQGLGRLDREDPA